MRSPIALRAAGLAVFLGVLLGGAPRAAAVSAPSLLQRARAELRSTDLSDLGGGLGRPGAWTRPEPEPQGRLGIQERPSGERGLLGAVWRSAVLPGWGQRYLDAPGRGLVFMGAEAATWGTWTTFKVQESLRRDSYIEMAQVFAGVAGDDHSDDYWKYVGQHASWLDYNEWLRFEARREFGFGTDEYYGFIADNEVGADEAWDWNSFDRQLDFLEKRKASNNAERRATYTLYALLVNRVVAVVDTWRLHRSRESIREELDRELDQAGLEIQAFPADGSLALRVGWFRGF